MSFLGNSSGSHHRAKSPARSVVSTAPGGQNVFIRDKSPSRHAHRSRSEPEGFFSRKRSKSRSRSRSPTGIAGFLGVGGSSSKHRSRSPGLFGGDSRSHHSRSRARSPSMFGGMFGGSGGNRRDRDRSPQSDIRSFFGGGGKHVSSTSRYGRRPREGLVQKILGMLRRTWRNLSRYAKNNPIKMVTLVIMPLLTSGILVKILGSLGIRLPASIASLVGGKSAPQGGGGYYGSQGYGGAPGGGQGGGGGGGGGIGISEVMNVAKMFM